jgi:hypothetical protein
MKTGHSVRSNTDKHASFFLLLFALATAATPVASAFRNNSLLTRNNKAIQNTLVKKTRMSSSSLPTEEATSNGRLGIDYPELVVFDLDACFWDQEMYVREIPGYVGGSIHIFICTY